MFFGTHFFTAFRQRDEHGDCQTGLAAGPYMGLYSLLTIGGFVALVWGYAQSEAVDPAGYTRPTGCATSPWR